MPSRLNRTSVSLPAELLAAIDRAIREGRVRSRNELFAVALRRELAIQERAAIGAAFAGMAEDEDARSEADALSEEFARADWEAVRLAESR